MEASAGALASLAAVAVPLDVACCGTLKSDLLAGRPDTRRVADQPMGSMPVIARLLLLASIADRQIMPAGRHCHLGPCGHFGVARDLPVLMQTGANLLRTSYRRGPL
jgi:hypothetical protein